MYPEGGWSCIRNGGMRKTTPWTLDQDLMRLKPKIDNPNWASLVLFVQHTIIICFYSYCPNLVKNWNSLWLRSPMTTDWLLWPESFFGMWSVDQTTNHPCHRSFDHIHVIVPTVYMEHIRPTIVGQEELWQIFRQPQTSKKEYAQTFFCRW